MPEPQLSPTVWLITSEHLTSTAVVPLLTAKGYTAVAMDCSDDLFKRLRFQRAALIIIDCGMSDSFETLHKIRSDPRYQAVPVLMFSAADDEMKDKALLKGADGYVGKASLDWLDLLKEVVRLAGPPSRE